MKYLQRAIVLSLLFIFVLSLLFANSASATPGKAEIDEYAKQNGFPRSDYPYFEPVNKCGGEGATEAVPDKFEVRDPIFDEVLFSVDFTKACNRHDRCYMTYGSSRSACDDKFATDLAKACSDDISDALILPQCLSATAVYAAAVYAAGGLFFPDAQDNARRYKDLVDPFISSNWGAGAREASRYCTSNGFGAGFPDGEEGIENGNRVIGIHCLNGTSRFSVPSNISLSLNWGAGAREASRYCTSNGFGAGFPDGEEGIENGNRVIGIHCLNGTSRFSIPSNISVF